MTHTHTQSKREGEKKMERESRLVIEGYWLKQQSLARELLCV